MSVVIPRDKFAIAINLGSRIKYVSSRYGETFARVVSMHLDGTWISDQQTGYVRQETVTLRVVTEPNAKYDETANQWNKGRGYRTPITNLKGVEVVD